ncbi:MAG: hypothetical protein KGJ78_15815 [Alphaproteobacteria bacterium]|nr:hypothetical protein [Alphaproteobacteria bacterium]
MAGQSTAGQHRHSSFTSTIATVVLALAFCAGFAASAPPPGDQQCLACHQSEALVKPLADGDSLSLHISGGEFAKSVHSAFGCKSCHRDIDPARHPASASIASKRDFSIERAKVCSGCHSEQYHQWERGVHAALVRAGNPVAPLCTSCHSPHAVMRGAAQAMDTVPCQTCHGAIFTAYASSIHGVLRAGGVTQAPLCFACHGAHDVKVASAGEGLRDACLSCHSEAIARHQTWLPNTTLHFQMISCPVCHAPKAQRTVDLVLYDSTSQADASMPMGVPEFENRSGANASGLGSAALFELLRKLNGSGASSKTSIRGHLDVRTGVEAHQLVPASMAISDCNTCHKTGADAFQSVTVSVAGPGGIPIRYDVNKNVLNSAFSIESISGFYAIGATRITLLDVLLILALLGGFGIPALHLIVRWLSKQPAKRDDNEQRQG